MSKCLVCSVDLVAAQKKFCGKSCAAKHNNAGTRRHGRPSKPCEYCGVAVRASGKFCSYKCTKQSQYEKNIQDWKTGLTDGLNTNGTVTKPVKRFLREKFGDKCCLCGWNQINPFTGVSPLVADHIDGNWRNNTEENLRLICPNCDSLTETYCGANVGKGRKTRAKPKRIK